MTGPQSQHGQEAATVAAALDALRRRHTALVDAVPDLLWLKDLEGRFVAANAAFAAYLGRHPRDVVGRCDTELFPPDLVDRFREQERHVVDDDAVLVVEESVPLPDGTLRWYETVKAPFRDASGRITATVGAARDISRRRAAEERLRRVVETIPDGAVYVEGERVIVNRAVQELLGWSPRDLATKDDWFGRLFGGDAPAVRAAYEADRAHGLASRRVFPVRHRDGSTRWIEFGGAAGDGFEVWLLHDVTARHEAEARLERQHRVLEDLQALATIGSWEWDARTDRVEWSLELRRICGVPADVPLTFASFTERVHPDDRARVLAAIDRSGQRREPFAIDHRIRRADGGVRLLHMRGRPLDGEDGALAGFVGSAQDVTERTQLEARLAQAEKLEAVGQLAGGVAHDFNNMLTAVIGNLDLVAGTLPDGPARLDLAEARRAAERAAELTRQLLAYGRKQVLSPRLLDVNRVLADNAVLLSRALPASVTFDLVRAPQVPRVRADPGQLVRVLMNLVLNARDAVRAAGGGTVRVETASRRVTEEEAARLPSPLQAGPMLGAGRYVSITVRDSGVGMDAATRARVFEPFFTTKPVGEGTGLGLATVFGIVTQSGGAVHVESEPGQGSAFTVLLPAVEDADADPPSAAPGGAETVLVVEDDGGVRGVARRVLQRQGYTVLEAEHAEGALRCIAERDGAVDLVLTDVRMPGMDGRELARRLRAAHPPLRVVLMSGFANEGAATDDLPFLAKPFTAAGLLHAVRAAIDAR